MNQEYYIYKLTCTTNGKGYVGYTSDIQRRMREHKKTAGKGNGQAIHAAIRKYGWDSFVMETLFRSADKQQTLAMENQFIVLHETKGAKGYNLTRGRQQGPPKGYKWNGKHSGETKTKIANHHAHLWMITYPDGRVEIIKNLRKFCRDHNLSKGHMTDVTTGRRTHCHGYACKKLEH
jgi:group I intron endonuclease